MSHLLPRFSQRSQRLADERRLAQILSEAGESVPTQTVARATLAGDSRRLRGIPVCAMGVSGTSPGTDPFAAAARNL